MQLPQRPPRQCGMGVWAGAARQQGLIVRVVRQALLFLVVTAALCPLPASAWDNGLARTPPMGWNGWNCFGCAVSAALVKEMADALVASGMRDAGYEYIIIDDCWQIKRDADGAIVADPLLFPHGIQEVADYVHARGLKLGLYSDAGSYTCQGRPGSLGYERQDVATYAGWGVDYIKVDWCYSQGLDPRVQYALWHDALAELERPLVFSICNWGLGSPWTWGASTGHLWRTTYDIQDRWERVLKIADVQADLAAYGGPGGWNDPDMLEVGNGGMTDGEYRAHFSLWAIMAAPLIAGNDLRDMSASTRAILTNAEVIAVDQDAAGIQGSRVAVTGDLEVWAKPLAERGARAVLLLNRGEVVDNISVQWEQIGLGAGTAHVRDLWAHADLGTFGESFSAAVPPHGGVMVKLTGAEPAPPAQGEVNLAGLTWAFALNGLGPVERNASNGGQAAGDGGAITLNGKTYASGLGVHAASRIRYHLGGACPTFLSDVGLDDCAGSGGSVVFQVWADGVKLYDSGVMTGRTATQSPPLRYGDAGQSPALRYGDATQHIAVSVGDREYLELVVGDAGDDKEGDLANWAGARLVCWSRMASVYLPLVWCE